MGTTNNNEGEKCTSGDNDCIIMFDVGGEPEQVDSREELGSPSLVYPANICRNSHSDLPLCAGNMQE
jgi:hypothetical protein